MRVSIDTHQRQFCRDCQVIDLSTGEVMPRVVEVDTDAYIVSMVPGVGVKVRTEGKYELRSARDNHLITEEECDAALVAKNYAGAESQV